MATNTEIYEEINGEVDEDLTLGATSSSKVAEHRKIIYIVTAISSVLQGLWDIMKGELQAAADSVPTCNDAWWDQEIRKFQYGHELLLNDQTKKYYYATQDEDAQIIDRVAVVSQQGKGIIKVAKSGPVALSSSEKAALSSFVKKIQPLGSNVYVVSQDADIIQIPGTVYYDPIIPLTTTQPLVEQAVNEYLSSLDFNVGKTGTFYTTYLTDAIQAVNGVVDFIPSEIKAGQSNAAELSPVLRKYIPVAGYVQVDPSHPLSISLTYVAES